MLFYPGETQGIIEQTQTMEKWSTRLAGRRDFDGHALLGYMCTCQRWQLDHAVAVYNYTIHDWPFILASLLYFLCLDNEKPRPDPPPLEVDIRVGGSPVSNSCNSVVIF